MSRGASIPTSRRGIVFSMCSVQAQAAAACCLVRKARALCRSARRPESPAASMALLGGWEYPAPRLAPRQELRRGPVISKAIFPGRRPMAGARGNQADFGGQATAQQSCPIRDSCATRRRARSLAAAIPGSGDKQTPTAATCASNTPVSGEMQVTFTLPNVHGVTIGNTFAAAGFTPSGYNATYTALPGSRNHARRRDDHGWGNLPGCCFR